MRENVIRAVQEAKKRSKRRGFVQTFDLIINFKNIDLTKAENRVSREIVLPHGRGKKLRIAFFAESLLPKLREFEDIEVLRKADIPRLTKGEVRRIDHFLAEAPLMPLIARSLGKILGPRGKMPTPVPPSIRDLKPLIEGAQRTVRFRLRESPIAHLPVGTETMPDEAVAENILEVLRAVEAVLPKRREQIRDVYLKLTMGPTVKIE
jgi:large subunit ribosomal protein L1